MEGAMTEERGRGDPEEDRPRFLALSLTLAVLCALSWWLMGGGEMLAGLAERRGGGTAALLTGGGFVGVVMILYAGMRLFHWSWTRGVDSRTRVPGPGS